MSIQKTSGTYQGWMIEPVSVAAVQGQVAQIIAHDGMAATPLSPDLSVNDKFIILLEAFDELGHLLTMDIVSLASIMRQVFKIAALAAMFGESLMET